MAHLHKVGLNIYYFPPRTPRRLSDDVFYHFSKRMGERARFRSVRSEGKWLSYFTAHQVQQVASLVCRSTHLQHAGHKTSRRAFQGGDVRIFNGAANDPQAYVG